jgi:nitroimidazol reductase NimA-like FMN-containing flavoprotein (pyridoxamine 5'-phosphate oxidase superfamily)
MSCWRMPVTSPWLAGPAPSKRLPHARLAERILNLLSSQNMCVLATYGAGGPLATPVRYYHLDFALMFTAAANSPKMRNLAADPRLSIGIFAPLVGQASSRGAQIFGRARILAAADADFEHYWPAYRWHSDHAERSRSFAEPPSGPLVVVDAERIVYTEHWLRRDGYAPRQFWSASGAADFSAQDVDTSE